LLYYLYHNFPQEKSPMNAKCIHWTSISVIAKDKFPAAHHVQSIQRPARLSVAVGVNADDPYLVRPVIPVSPEKRNLPAVLAERNLLPQQKLRSPVPHSGVGGPAKFNIVPLKIP
jgi:hypothetical protein